jgi:hypothetical protein
MVLEQGARASLVVPAGLQGALDRSQPPIRLLGAEPAQRPTVGGREPEPGAGPWQPEREQVWGRTDQGWSRRLPRSSAAPITSRPRVMGDAVTREIDTREPIPLYSARFAAR